MSIIKTTGLIAAPFAPMNEKGDLNLEIIPSYRAMLINNGISGVFINGTTGESMSLTMKEKQQIVEAWTGPVTPGGNFRVINLVGGNSVTECAEFAGFSRQRGVDAVAVTSPYFLRPAGVKDLAEFIKVVAGEVPELPVYYYHIPVLSGVGFPMLDLLKAVNGNIPNFAGIKYTHYDLMDYLACLGYEGGRFDLLYGTDEMYLPALVLGCRGAVGSTYNYLAPLFKLLTGRYESGDIAGARELQQKANEAIYLLKKYGGIRTGKAFMRYIGIDCGNFRAPLSRFEENTYLEFLRDVRALGIDAMMSLATSNQVS
jgi:N-acetylneuraminate lyase